MRFALILTAILGISSPVFAQESQSSEPPRTPSAQLRVEPLPRLRMPTAIFAEPIPAWNIHGHAEVIPNLRGVPLKTRARRDRQPVPSESGLPRIEETTAAETRARPKEADASGR